MKAFIKKYSHAWIFSYFIIYLIWFFWLEQRQVSEYVIVESILDNKIPFCEVFIIPYFLWFLYLYFGVAYFFLKDRKEFYKLAAMMTIGLTICLIIYTVWPNMQVLRPEVMIRKNIFTNILGWLYRFDTPTNVCPSIHIYASLVIHAAVIKSKHFVNNKHIRYGSAILCICICASTVFLKQHSILDVVYALILFYVLYIPIYLRVRKVPQENVYLDNN